MPNKNKTPVAVIGAGLAGSEAAWQLAERGHLVHLYEMRPQQKTEAHKTGHCAELVCSNSFKSQSEGNAHGLLKAEMTLFDSLILRAAKQFAIPAGQALAVDRDRFSEWITAQLQSHANIRLFREEVKNIEDFKEKYSYLIIATGPLTSQNFSQSLQKELGTEYLSFYDAIAPVIMADSIDMNIAFKASRYDKGEADYINCPMNQKQYKTFILSILEAEKVPLHQFENTRPFEGCLPIEVMAERGEDTLRYGPMKPVGLNNPRTGEKYYAVIQLRQENTIGSLYNMVGFQTKMTWTAQKEIFRAIPGLENAKFVRLGSIHRNTFINSPHLLTATLHLKSNPHIYFAGQITGVEGYMESTAMGIIAARQIVAQLEGNVFPTLPPTTMIGGLLRYITETSPQNFQPINANFGLLNPPDIKIGKKEKKAYLARKALETMKGILKEKE